MSKLVLTREEKKERTISRHNIIVLGSMWNYEIYEIRMVFEQYKLPYNYNSMRTTYYRTKYNWFPIPKISKENTDKVQAMFDSVIPQRPVINIEKKKEEIKKLQKNKSYKKEKGAEIKNGI